MDAPGTAVAVRRGVPVKIKIIKKEGIQLCEVDTFSGYTITICPVRAF